jgi:hypothetical protein
MDDSSVIYCSHLCAKINAVDNHLDTAVERCIHVELRITGTLTEGSDFALR